MPFRVLRRMVCGTSYPVDVGIPGKGTGDINPEIFCACDRLQDLAMQYVVSSHRSFGA